jgi:hypothetical protein
MFCSILYKGELLLGFVLDSLGDFPCFSVKIFIPNSAFSSFSFPRINI